MWKIAPLIGITVATFFAFQAAMNLQNPLGGKPETLPKTSLATPRAESANGSRHTIEPLLTGEAGFDSNVIPVFAHKPIDVPTGAKALTVEIPLDRGVAIQGRVVGVNGTTPERVKVTYRGDFLDLTDVLSGDHAWPVYDGHLTIRGVPPDDELLAYLLDPIGKQGKMLHVHGSDAGAPLNVTLEKCGRAKLRFIDADGKGVPGYMPTHPNQFVLLFVPEAALDGSTSADDLMGTEGVQQGVFDHEDYRELMTDEDGWIALPALIPGAIYKLAFAELGPNKFFPREIKVRPGEELTLPDVVITDASVLKRSAEQWKTRQEK